MPERVHFNAVISLVSLNFLVRYRMHFEEREWVEMDINPSLVSGIFLAFAFIIGARGG